MARRKNHTGRSSPLNQRTAMMACGLVIMIGAAAAVSFRMVDTEDPPPVASAGARGELEDVTKSQARIPKAGIPNQQGNADDSERRGSGSTLVVNTDQESPTSQSTVNDESVDESADNENENGDEPTTSSSKVALPDEGSETAHALRERSHWSLDTGRWHNHRNSNRGQQAHKRTGRRRHPMTRTVRVRTLTPKTATTAKPETTVTTVTTAEPQTTDTTVTTAEPETTVAPATTAKPATTAEPSPSSSTSAKPATTSKPTPTTARPTTTTEAPSTSAGEWYEGFDNLDKSRWAPEHSTYGDGNGERQCYRPDNVSVQGGRLILRAEETNLTCRNGSARTVASGMVRSKGLTFSPGQGIEFRVKLNVGNSSNQAGLWPAVWSSSFGPGGWPKGGELDFLEVMTAEDPRRAMFSMHFADSNGRHKLQNKPAFLDKTFSGDWHTVRFDYGRRGNLTWYLDGQEAFKVDSAPTGPFDQPIREIKINLAVGGSPGALAPGALGTDATFEVDYIRVFNL